MNLGRRVVASHLHRLSRGGKSEDVTLSGNLNDADVRERGKQR